MKKIVKVDGKTYLFDDETKGMEEVEASEETVEETPKEENPVEEKVPTVEETPKVDEDNEAKIDEAAKKVMKELGIDEIKSQLNDLVKKSTGSEVKGKKISDLLELESAMNKSVDQMTTNEKIVGFYQAMLQNNHGVLKALSEGVAADGGYLFPDEFRAEVIRDITDGNYMRSEVSILPMQRDVMNIPSLESRPKVTWTDENAAKSTTTAHFGQETLTVKKMAAILYASDELVEDSTEIDIVRFIIGLFSEVIGEEEDRVIWQGNGTTQPTGVSTVRAAGGINTRNAGGTLSIDSLIDLIYDLPNKYQKNAKIYAHRTQIRTMRKLKDSSNRYYWQEPVSQGQPALFYGFPVIEANDLPEKEIYFGDMKKAYWLGDRRRMTVKISQDTETAFTKDQTAIRVVERIAGNVVLGLAMRCLNNI